MNEAKTWEKLPAIEGKHGGCLNCGPRPSYFPAEEQIAVGFGYAELHRDGEPVYTEPNDAESEDAYMTGRRPRRWPPPTLTTTGASCWKGRCRAARTSATTPASGRWWSRTWALRDA